MHPFFDVSGLTDEELRDKINVLNTRLYAATAMSMSYDMKQQLITYISVIEEEMQNRYAVEMHKMWDAQFPEIIETEPDLKPGVAAKKTETEQKKEGRKERPANAPQFNKVYRK